jgi:putative heme-binding domain-containing protein
MRSPLVLSIVLALPSAIQAADRVPLPHVAEGWKAELVVQAPAILFPTAVVAAPDGTVYLGQDPMDMPGPPTEPIDSIVAIKDGRVRVFAERLWSVMGLEWSDGTLYVVHAPYLSALRDTDGDGRADARVDLMTGLGPKLPGFNGINDHVASGVRLGIDGFLYISVGDKGIPRGVGRDGTTIRVQGGGVIRIRPDGTGLEVVSTGERNPLSVMLGASDEVFTYGNDDDSKRWPNSLTHHVVGGHYGYPYQFLTAPDRCLPVLAGQVGGSGTQGICYNEDGLPARYRGNLFVCDWGLQTVVRYAVERAGGTFRVTAKEPLVTAGSVPDFRPFALAVSADGAALYLVDWAFTGWLADGPKTGRLYRLTYDGRPETRDTRHETDRVTPAPRPSGEDLASRLAALDHPALAVRRDSQRILAAQGTKAVAPLVARLKRPEPRTGRLHALWALDAIGAPEGRGAIRAALSDPDAEVRLQAARSSGIRRDGDALAALGSLLRDPEPSVRREAAIALEKLGDPAAAPALLAALGDPDRFASWSIRHALRTLAAWDVPALVAALTDPRRRDDALTLTDEAWALPVVDALTEALARTEDAPTRVRIVVNLAGLYRRYPEWSGHWFGTNPLAGQMPQKTRDWSPAGMTRVLIALVRGLNDADALVRRQAIVGLRAVGAPAAPYVRARLERETDPGNLALLAAALGTVGDLAAVPGLGALVRDASRPLEARVAALDALAFISGPPALKVRLALVYDETAPTELVARALPALGRSGVVPPNDLAGFLDRSAPAVRVAALEALAARGAVPDLVRTEVVARLDDPAPEVRAAAIDAVARLRMREAVPALMGLAGQERFRTEAARALGAVPDPRALPIYLAALEDRNPDLRRAAEAALVVIRDAVAGELEARARSQAATGPAALALERVLTRFRPVTTWRVIGPFPRTTAPVFVGEPSIDFAKTRVGVEGRALSWTVRAAEPASGRVVLDDFKAGAGDRGGFGYDTNGSPDLCAFGFAEVASDRDRPALLLVGSSGTIAVTLNEQVVFDYYNFAGRAYIPDSDLVRVALKKGANRLLVRSRQGIGTWSFGVQVSDPSMTSLATRPGVVGLEELRAFALTHDGDAARGRALFFDPRGIGCVKCHAADGQGTATVGPDLTGLALKYDRAEIIRSVLEPSNRLATGYQPLLVATADGRVLAGLLRAETDASLDLIDADAKVTRVAKADIDERRLGDVSLMPTGLVDALKPEEFADLIAYLQSLKTAPPPALADP